MNFDPLHCPLFGRTLIEANAGTGKTYSIGSLYLRLLLESRMAVRSILVVTFTRAAVAELRDRIRKRIVEALQACKSGFTEDPFLSGLLSRAKDPDESIHIFLRALTEFDEAAIHTIHGFCQRMTGEHFFESNSTIDAQLIPDPANFVHEVAIDFWRTHWYHASPLFVQYCNKKSISVDTLIELVRLVPLVEGGCAVVPEVSDIDTVKLETDFASAAKAVISQWQISGTEVISLLRNSPDLNRATFRLTMVDTLEHEMAVACKTGFGSPLLFDTHLKLTNAEIERCCKKNKIPPRHDFFNTFKRLVDAADRLCDAYHNKAAFLKNLFIKQAPETLVLKKSRANQCGYDDLIRMMRKALVGPMGPQLKAALCNRFCAALIDEFQDTDSAQYEIFSTIFSNNTSPLFFIGDPKQAIYGFRGADIFAYMKARQDADRTCELIQNRRAHPKLLNAINTLFSHRKSPFFFDWIPYIPSTSAKDVGELIDESDAKTSALRIWHISGNALQNDIAICSIVAAEGARLLCDAASGRVRIRKSDGKERPMLADDVAVLVRTNIQARMMQRAFAKMGIATVLHSRENVFLSHEANELNLLLCAVTRPRHIRAICSALSTDMLGEDSSSISSILSDPILFGRTVSEFVNYKQQWEQQGCMVMLRACMASRHVQVRLRALPDGERRLTNTEHLCELLYRHEYETHCTTRDLLTWFTHQQNEDLSESKEEELRLETDDPVVTIATIHHSKGLQYPVVFAPFAARCSAGKRTGVVYHDPSGDNRFIVDIGDPASQQALLQSRQESLAEALRLFYVAVTRAQYRCYCAWVDHDGSDITATDYLLDPLVDISEKMAGPDTGRIAGLLTELVAKSEGGIAVIEPVTQDQSIVPVMERATEKLQCRNFLGPIASASRIVSYTSLSKSAAVEFSPADRDFFLVDTIYPEKTPVDKSFANFHLFPRGASAGTFLHKILESVDFSDPGSSMGQGVIVESLRNSGFDVAWAPCIAAMIARVSSVALDGGSLSLNKTGLQQRISEMQFYLPLQAVSARAMFDFFSQTATNTWDMRCAQRLTHLATPNLSGFLTGFIDLVFEQADKYYIVDWKSNVLGASSSEYYQETLENEVIKEYYFLQYTLYTVALDRYLSQRMAGYSYETKFGGVYYLFLRGIDAPMQGGQGIFFNRPSVELINQLSALFYPEKL